MHQHYKSHRLSPTEALNTRGIGDGIADIVVDALKFRLVQYGAFYNGQVQQDIFEWIMIQLEVINGLSTSLWFN